MEAEERLLTKNAHTKAEKIIKLRGGPHNALDSGKLSVKGRAHSGIIKTLREWDIYIYIKLSH